MYTCENIRNVAIIAHIDHGKTTMLDALLQQASVFRENASIPERVMDSDAQEQERGITIFSKHTAIPYNDFKINLIDTPGHADFSGEVERVLGMVQSVLLLVDAKEGPMPQTRFVLSKALKMGLRPIVVVNKIDRPHADPQKALDMTFDLFVELGASDEQLDFSYCFASGLAGYAVMDPEDHSEDMKPLLDLITQAVPKPSGSLAEPFSLQAASLYYDDFLGRQTFGRILSGSLRKGQSVLHVNNEGKRQNAKITRIEGYMGLEKVEMEEAAVGDIVCLSGVENISIGDGLCSPDSEAVFEPIDLDEPTVSIDIMVNSGPLSGKEGKFLTMSQIRQRLTKEKRANISLQIELDNTIDGVERAKVSGRGELHLSVLIEAMRREGFELTFSKPVVLSKEINGVKQEPFERVHVELPEEFSGACIEELCRRKGELLFLDTDPQGISKLEFLIPTRGLMGYRSEFLTMSKGLGILTSVFEKFAPWKGSIPSRKKGVLVSMSSGKANSYACSNLQERATLFVAPGDEAYEGMIVGENSRDNDLVVNIVKGKQLTNVRASGKDDAILLTPPRKLNLEEAIDFIQDDELVEVTPASIRLRKKYLSESDRKRFSRK